MKKLLLVSFALGLTVSAFAADVVGKYNGKLFLDVSAVKKMVKDKAAKGTADQKKQGEQMLAAIDKQIGAMNASIIKLELKKDGTLKMVQTAAGKTETDTGKWSVKGSTIKFSSLSSKTGPKELTGTISKDGKTLFFDLSEEIKKQAKSSGGPPAKGSLTFKRA